jgi:hypothetical protein
MLCASKTTFRTTTSTSRALGRACAAAKVRRGCRKITLLSPVLDSLGVSGAPLKTFIHVGGSMAHARCLHSISSVPTQSASTLHCFTGGYDLCGDRLQRYQQRNSTGKVDEVKTNGTGRATVIHFHGEASVPSMDGWAEQYFCEGESKVIHCTLKTHNPCALHQTISAAQRVASERNQAEVQLSDWSSCTTRSPVQQCLCCGAAGLHPAEQPPRNAVLPRPQRRHHI